MAMINLRGKQKVKKILIFIVVVSAMSLISGISGVQARGISGRVTDALGNGIGNVYVAAFDYNSNLWIIGSSTDSVGNYSLNVRAGTYKVRFSQSPSDGYYAPEWYDNKSNSAVADLVTVKGFRATTNINAQLEIGGTISGRVTDASGNAIANVVIGAPDLYGHWMPGSSTDNNGNYSFNMPAGTYKVIFRPLPSDGYNAPEWYDNKRNFQVADLVTITAQTTSSVDAQLEIGGTISGRVTNTLGYAIANVYVGASDPIYGWMGAASTDRNGNYSFNVPPGTYKVYFTPPSGGYYAQEWYGNKSNFQVADLVTVTANQTTSNINAQLEQAGKIYGRVTDESGNGIADVYVEAYDPNESNIVFNSATTGSEGSYVITLAAGNYKVRFSPGADSGDYAMKWYNDKSNFQSADIVTVKRFNKFTINVQLEPK
jgi:uncharacterized protein YodC (DUF2158 family)